MNNTSTNGAELTDYELNTISEKTDDALEETEPGQSPEAYQALIYIRNVVDREVQTGTNQ